VDNDSLAAEREKLGTILDDAQAQLGSMVEYLMASLSGEKDEIYKVGMQTNSLLESISEVVIAWQLLRQAEIAMPKLDEDPFYLGKVESARWFLDDVAPKVAARRARAEAEDGSLMDLPVEAF
jgi:hypothetical protein